MPSYDQLTMDEAREVVRDMPEKMRNRKIADLELQLAAIGNEEEALDDFLVEASCLDVALLAWWQGGADVEPERKPQYGRLKIAEQA